MTGAPSRSGQPGPSQPEAAARLGGSEPVLRLIASAVWRAAVHGRRLSVTGLAQDDVTRMRDQLFFEGPERSRRLSRCWLLLLLSAVIASAGVVSDSTATVIGANPAPDLAVLRQDLDAAGLNGLDVRVSLVPASYKPLPG